jgi:hypothetical protein
MTDKFNQYIHKLIDADPLFRDWWIELGDARRHKIEHILMGIDEQYLDRPSGLESKHEWCSLLLGILFRNIEQRELLGYEVPRGWQERIGSQEERDKSLSIAEHALMPILELSPVKLVDFYGDIKRGAPHRIIGDDKINLWDMVRFRAVVKDLFSLSAFSAFIIEMFGDNCVRVRNLYLAPPKSKPDRGYRGIHLLLVLDESELIELQVRSEIREYVSWLDHYVYKQAEKALFTDSEHLWLRTLSLKANLAECETFIRDAANTLHLAG